MEVPVSTQPPEAPVGQFYASDFDSPAALCVALRLAARAAGYRTTTLTGEIAGRQHGAADALLAAILGPDRERRPERNDDHGWISGPMGGGDDA